MCLHQKDNFLSAEVRYTHIDIIHRTICQCIYIVKREFHASSAMVNGHPDFFRTSSMVTPS